MRSIKLNAIKIARIGILAFCFIMAFAMIFASPASEVINDVAYAAEDEEGTMVRATGDSGELTVEKFGFPGNDSSKRVWTYNETFANFTFSTDSLSGHYHKDGGSLIAAADMYVENYRQDGKNGFKMGIKSHQIGGFQMFAAFNYDMSSFLTDLIASHTGATVTAEVRVNIDKNNGNNVGVNAMGTKSMVSGDNISTLLDGASLSKENGFTISKDGSGDYVSTTGTQYNAALSPSAPNLAIVFAHGGGNTTASSIIYNIRIKFTITLNETPDSVSTFIKDGEAPIIADATITAPFRADNTNDNTDWNFTPSSSDITKNLEDTILALYQSNKDYVDSKNNAYHNSYVDASRDKYYIDGHEYYKSVSSVYTDTYCYGRKNGDGSKNVTTATSATKWFASGIKSVQIGQNIVNLYGIAEGEKSALTAITIPGDDGNDVVCGWFRVTKTHRAEVAIETYFSRNGNFSVTVTDYGDKQITRAINISGIDLHDPSDMETFIDDAKEYLLESSQFTSVASWDTIKWHNLSTLSFDFNEDLAEAEAGHTPYMWFYSVVKADTPTELYSDSWDRSSLMMRMPFAVNGLSFVYDFETGYANPTYKNGDVLYGVDNQNMGTNATGAGYYLFTFYKMDLSGRFDPAKNVVSYYVKVDYDKATHTLEKSAGENALANTDWAAGAPLVITLTQDKANLSGNTLTFNYIDVNENELTANIFVKDGAIIDGTGNTFVLNEGTGKEVTVTYALDGSGKAVWTVTFGAVPEKTEQGTDIYFKYNYVTPFDIATGVDLNAENLITYTDKGTDNEYASGVHVRVDRNAPVTPNLMNRDELEGEYIVEISDFEIPEIG
ncbi:MAG: hypothetical protein IJ978_04200, partial [Clostridia bacterium]|nr:hypothetical protein [Clostridia bacterium]